MQRIKQTNSTPANVFDDLNDLISNEGMFSANPLIEVKEEVDVWDKFAKEYSQLNSLYLEQVRYLFIHLIEFGEQHYTLIKK